MEHEMSELESIATASLSLLESAGLLEKNEIAKELTVSTRTLDRWHTQRIGPPRVQIGRKIFYRRSSLIEWLQAQEDSRKGRRR
jgi:predicted DNA-binding transcriptional regulator AlpA